eukprot:1404810-Pleurochrysis_carterae.AAC.1
MAANKLDAKAWRNYASSTHVTTSASWYYVSESNIHIYTDRADNTCTQSFAHGLPPKRERSVPAPARLRST